MSEKPKAPAVPREFEPVLRAEFEQMLDEGAKGFCSALIWTKDQKHVLSSHLTFCNEQEKYFYSWRPKDFDPIEFTDWLAAGDHSCFFSVSLSRANIFFRAVYVSIDRNGLKFKFPEKVFKVQRRKDLRFVIPDGWILKIRFQDPLFPENRLTKKVYDISASGCAVILPYDEMVIYQSGLVLKDLTMEIKGREVKMSGEVRHTASFQDEKHPDSAKVGILFREIKPGDVQHVAAYVFEESRRYYARFLG